MTAQNGKQNSGDTNVVTKGYKKMSNIITLASIEMVAVFLIMVIVTMGINPYFIIVSIVVMPLAVVIFILNNRRNKHQMDADILGGDIDKRKKPKKI